MHSNDIGLRYQQLVHDRRRLGDERYGARHLRRNDLASDRVQEAADTVVYLTLTGRAWAAGQVPFSAELEERLARLIRDAIRLGERCSALAEPDAPAAEAFAAVLRERFDFGERHHGEAFLARENLGEALEEIVDCDILVELERERDRANARPNRELGEISDSCAALGELVLALRDRVVREHPHILDGEAIPADRRALQAERDGLARLIERVRVALAASPRPHRTHANGSGNGRVPGRINGAQPPRRAA